MAILMVKLGTKNVPTVIIFLICYAPHATTCSQFKLSKTLMQAFPGALVGTCGRLC